MFHGIQEALTEWQRSPASYAIQDSLRFKMQREANLEDLSPIITMGCNKMNTDSIGQCRRDINEHMFRQPLRVVASPTPPSLLANTF